MASRTFVLSKSRTRWRPSTTRDARMTVAPTLACSEFIAAEPRRGEIARAPHRQRTWHRNQAAPQKDSGAETRGETNCQLALRPAVISLGRPQRETICEAAANLRTLARIYALPVRWPES